MSSFFVFGFFDIEALMMIERSGRPIQKLVMRIFSKIYGARRW